MPSSNFDNESDRVIAELDVHVQKDPQFRHLLEASLVAADSAAQDPETGLDVALYDALDWPTTYPEYRKFLHDFARWAPRQSTDPAWTEPGTDEQQEVYDRLCHFYWLIDQPVGEGSEKVIVESLPWFSDWLIRYADAWGSFLDTTASFDQAILNSFLIDSPEYQVENSMVDGEPNAPSGWLTFNQFFARELNPGLRPIASPGNNGVIASPADCTFKAKYAIDENSTIPEITVKKTHTYASVEQLLEGSMYKDAFAGGQFVHYFLGPYSYHRFHTPVSGVVKECYPVHGKVYLDVNLQDGQFDAPDDSEGAYEFYQARGIITIDTRESPEGDVGIVAVIPIGMCQVSSVHMTATPGGLVQKGDEFGYFLFGGSDIIVLFQKGVAKEIFETPDSYTHYGTKIATANAKQITPSGK